jgi:NAD(P)H-dependent FMN reductase
LNQGQLLIVWHSRTGASRALAEAAAAGGGGAARLLAAEAAEPQDLLEASGYLFVCPENLGSMSGPMKDLFDRCYYPVLGRIEGRSYATIIAAGSDGQGAQAQIDRIVTGWRLRRVAEPLIAWMEAQTPQAILAEKQVSPQVLAKAAELGAGLAIGLEQGIF